jgi:uracil-DNA glycosylase family 4
VTEDFDPGALAGLIEEALGTKPAPEPPDQEENRILGPFDEPLLAKLSEILPRHTDTETTLAVMKELRLELVRGRTSYGDINKLEAAVSQCRRCADLAGPPRRLRTNTRKPDVLVVLESLVVSDSTVTALSHLLTDCGFDRERRALTGVTRCKGKVDSGCVEACQEYLMAELELLNPGLVVTLGNIPTQVLCGRDVKITEARGKIWWAGGLAILPSYSLAYADRSEARMDELHSDLRSGARLLYGD